MKAQVNASNATSEFFKSHREFEGLQADQKLGKLATRNRLASTTNPVKNGEYKRDNDPVHHRTLEVVLSKKRGIRQEKCKKTYPNTSSSSSEQEMISRQTIRKWKTREDELIGTIKRQEFEIDIYKAIIRHYKNKVDKIHQTAEAVMDRDENIVEMGNARIENGMIEGDIQSDPEDMDIQNLCNYGES